MTLALALRAASEHLTGYGHQRSTPWPVTGPGELALRPFAAVRAVGEDAPVGCPIRRQSTCPRLGGAHWKQHTGCAGVNRAPRGHHPRRSGRVLPGAEVALPARERATGDQQPNAAARGEPVRHGVQLEPDDILRGAGAEPDEAVADIARMSLRVHLADPREKVGVWIVT